MSFITDRQAINQLVGPIIKYQTGRFCRKYCNQQYFHFQCTLPEKAYVSPKTQSTLCEWGNASYGWMLDDLTNEKRLEKFRGTTEAQLGNYFFTIANSLAFFERWKNWRFGRRKNVPLYIKALSVDASKIFLSLCNGEAAPFIAQKLNKAEDEIEKIVDLILITLTKKGKLSLLQYPDEVLLSQMGNKDGDESAQYDLPSTEFDPFQTVADSELQQIFSALTVVERFVIENMIFDEYSAQEILEALKSARISVKPGLAVDDMNIQHVFYFLRKTLKKLKLKLMPKPNKVK